MKIKWSFSFAILFSLLFPLTSLGQVRISKNETSVDYSLANFNDQDNCASKTWTLPGLSHDKQLTYRPARPYMHLPINTNAFMGDSFWMGSMTTQSYNQGKIGRFYYWDIQGNLRGSLLFLDIAGKNKRGLKLVFPRQRGIF